MKTPNLILLLLMSFCLASTLFSQEIYVHKGSTLHYEYAKGVGKHYKGKRIGRWVDQTSTGIIYSEYFFDSIGMPIGTWTYNYPDGKIRFSVEYSNYKPQKFTIYRYSRELAEIISKEEIVNSTFKQLEDFENNMYSNEDVQVSSFSDELSDGLKVALTINPYEEIYKIASILIRDKFSGSITIWSPDKTKSMICTYQEGNELKTRYFYNKKKEIVKQEEYLNSKIVRTVIYKKNGEQKVKIY